MRPGLSHIRRIVGISTYGSPWSYVKLMNDNGRRILTRALRMSCGWRTRDDMAGAVRDRHRRRRPPAPASGTNRVTTGGAVTRVLVVYCHPNPQSFTAAARDRAAGRR